MLKPRVLNYYCFDDVKKFICQELGIEQKFFRDYHKVIGGSYKDFWHVWLSLHYDEIENGSYRELYFDTAYDRLSELKERYGEWIMVLSPVLKKLEEQTEEDYITIYYFW